MKIGEVVVAARKANPRGDRPIRWLEIPLANGIVSEIPIIVSGCDRTPHFGQAASAERSDGHEVGRADHRVTRIGREDGLTDSCREFRRPSSPQCEAVKIIPVGVPPSITTPAKASKTPRRRLGSRTLGSI